ncbi:uncharacterized protein LOC114355412 isoform X2 [Ostrinia furnacalis]|uniref:uncharacterized protein LOC114355412 isoform X2 n=1 Tax=Ostrinia furnacalis TaxID=93504 RepID=UPI00103B71BB|nr:uncharacterized protein LOC114355412 isoform X2 [Ostrinia furnacalis]
MAFVYSCCFWFSLRLGGILIGIFSVGLIALAGNCYAHTHTKQLKEQITYWTNNFDLINLAHYLEYIKDDPGKYTSLGITISCIYIIVCLLFIYGAYTCNNTLMIPYMVMETTRLVLLSILIANFLFLLKQNTMDIGLLIGASVGSGFFLLGMFYLWVCAVNLPIVVNEIKLDEQAATIRKLKQILENSNQRTFADTVDNLPYATDYGQPRNMMFIVSRNGLIKS